MGSGTEASADTGYKICYSAQPITTNGNDHFTHPQVDVWPAMIQVAGVYDDECTDANCLMEKKTYKCYVTKKSYNNPANVYESNSAGCVINYSGTKAGYTADTSGNGLGTRQGSWTPAFAADGTVLDCYTALT
jgi:hypothetical protein